MALLPARPTEHVIAAFAVLGRIVAVVMPPGAQARFTEQALLDLVHAHRMSQGRAMALAGRSSMARASGTAPESPCELLSEVGRGVDLGDLFAARSDGVETLARADLRGSDSGRQAGRHDRE